jgi:CheY-like chemotaxis protein
MPGPLIALVDDDALILGLMEELLMDEGYRALVFRGGAGVVATLGHLRPALVILDLRLERPDEGLRLLAALRAAPATTCLPVLLCTADAAFPREHGPGLAATGDPSANAPAERFFETLKHEEVSLKEYRTCAEAEANPAHFIETIRTHKRLHASLGYLPPAAFEPIHSAREADRTQPPVR